MSAAVSHELIQRRLVGEALDGGPVAVFVADDEGKYLAVNAFACELLGYEREELLALRVPEVAVEESAAAEWDAMLRSGERTGRTVLRRKDGRELPMHFRATQTTVGAMPLYVGVCWPIGAGRVGRDLNSGWNWLATNHGWSGSSTISTSRPS
jgi:PAS domain S-box-containing protein